MGRTTDNVKQNVDDFRILGKSIPPHTNMKARGRLFEENGGDQ